MLRFEYKVDLPARLTIILSYFKLLPARLTIILSLPARLTIYFHVFMHFFMHLVGFSDLFFLGFLLIQAIYSENDHWVLFL